VTLKIAAFLNSELLLCEIGCAGDATPLRHRGVHQLANRGENCRDRFVVRCELLFQARFELIQFLCECPYYCLEKLLNGDCSEENVCQFSAEFDYKKV
jgi:hypothetical protein